MAVTVSGKNYTQISSCDSITAGGTWSAGSQDLASYKEGTASLSNTMKSSGLNTWTFTPTAADDMSGMKHLRIWFLDSAPGLLTTKASGGIQIGISDGSNTGYWYMEGTDTYDGGWLNLAIDVSSAVDSGTKPTNMSAITSIIIAINQTSSGKNFDNVWIDNLCLADGLIAYGDDAGGYFDFDDIYLGDAATTLGIGICRRIGGVYYLTGSLEIGDVAGVNSTKFQAKSQTVIFENRPVNANLYAINVVDNGTGTTEFILGDKSGTAGIQGCSLRVASSTQLAKFDIDGSTDVDIDNFKIYASSFYGGDAISFPVAGVNVEILGCSFELCGQILPSSADVSGCFFINTTDVDAAILWNESIDITDCSFIANTTGAAIEMPSAVGSPYTYDSLTFSGNTYDVLNSSGASIDISKTNGSNPITYEGSTVNFIGSSVTTIVTVRDLSTGTILSGARVLVYPTDGTNFPYADSVTIVGSGTTATVTHTGHGLTNGDFVIIRGANEDVYNGVYAITVVDVNSYTYTTNETISSSPATGTITATFTFIAGLTDINGEISDTRVVNIDQPIAGWVRKASASPYYAQGSITGTVDSASGFSTTVQLAQDE